MISVCKKKRSFTKIKRSRSQPIWQRWGRYLYLRAVRLRENPKVIARGLAMGVFAGCFPLFGLQTIIGVALAFLVKGSKLAAAAGTWISNPLTYVPLFAFNYKIGQWFLGQPPLFLDQNNFNQNWDSWSELANLGTDFGITLFWGSFLVGLIASCLTYGVSLRLLRHHKREKN